MLLVERCDLAILKTIIIIIIIKEMFSVEVFFPFLVLILYQSSYLTICPQNTKGTRFVREDTVGGDAGDTCVPNNFC